MAENHNSKQDDLQEEIEKLTDKGAIAIAIEEFKAQLLSEYESSEARFKIIFEQSTFGNKIIDATLRIIKVNHALTELLGYTVDELLGTFITDIAHPDFIHDWKKLQADLWSAKHESFSIETCLIKKDKTVLWCHVTSIIFEDKRERFGYTIIEDISDRKNYERIRAEVEAKKDEFISIVSHELRTPLTTIKAINQLLEKKVSKDQTYYGFILKSNHHILRLEKLIADLFDVAKIKGGSIDLDKSTFDLNEVVVNCIAGLQTIHPTHEIKYEGPQSVMILGDSFRIEQVLINFINNAIKYSPSSNQIEVVLSRSAEQVKVSVRDYGIGIARKNIDKVFDRYYRVGEVKHHFQGLGLGLFISSQIILKHNGTYGIESKLHSGTTIWFTLPLFG